MDPPKKRQQPTAAASPKKPASALLDAYEVECIRRELEILLLKQNAGEAGAAANSCLDAAAEILGLRRRRSGHNSKKTVSATKNANPAPAPAPAPPTKKLLLGKHAAMICGGAAVAASSAGSGGPRPRRAGYREVEKV